MSVDQSEFTAAILNPDLAVPKGLSDPAGHPAGRRFDVYRNNVAVSLTEALKAAFPVVLKMVGDEFFTAMSSVYLRQYPPSSPVMMYYGADMPAFLNRFEPVAHLGYLPDTARLEIGLRDSYHAADAQPIDPQHLQDLPPERLMAAKMHFAPSMRLIRSQWPIFALWQANTKSDAPQPVMQAQSVLIVRPEFDPQPVLLEPGADGFVDALLNDRTFGEAVDAGGDALDLGAALGVLLANGAITKISEGTET